MAPTAKPVTANYDSDDGRIIELKQLGYSDEFVAAKLIEEGRIRYVGKTIGSRYLRLRKVLDDKEDDKLDDELSDWHEGEVCCEQCIEFDNANFFQDDKLVPIVQAMEKKLNRQIEALKVRMWKDVASFFAGQIGGKKKYTHKACRERYDAVLAGTELQPIELDEDKVGRRRMREERIKAAKAARIAAADEAIELEARKKAKTTERKRAIAEANQKKVAFQLKRIAEKNERLRIRDERNANRELAKQTRLRILNHMRIERDWEMEKNRREKEIYKRIMGIDLNGKPASRPSNKGKITYDSDEESEAIDDLESDEEEANFTDAEDAEDADDESENEHEHVDAELEDPTINDDALIVSSPAPAVVKLTVANRPQRKRKSTNVDVSVGNLEEQTSPPIKKISSIKKTSTSKKRVYSKTLLENGAQSPAPARKKISPPKKKQTLKPAPALPDGSNAVVTKDTLFSPRSIMTRTELDMICFTRNIARRPASDESHPELVARMHAVDESLNRQELDDLLRQATESVSGNRLSKIERLQKSEASRSIAGGMGLDAHDLDHMRRYEGFTGEFKKLLDDAEHTAARHQPVVADKSMEDVPAFADW